MGPATLAGLALQAVAVGLVAWRVRRNPLASAGLAFAAMAFLYHGLVELWQLPIAGLNAVRDEVSSADLGAFVLAVGKALLAFALGYVIAVGRWPAHGPRSAHHELDAMRWPVYAAAALLTGLALFSRVGAVQQGLDTEAGYWTTGLVGSFAPILQVIAVVLLARQLHGERALGALFVAYAVVLALSGSRLSIILGLWTSAGILSRLGFRVRARHLAMLGGTVAVMMLAISAARVIVGRESLVEQAGAQRGAGLVRGIQGARRDASVREGVLGDFVYRADANSFNALVGVELRSGAEPIGVLPLLADAAVMVPSFLNPNKLSGDPKLMNEEFLVTAYYGLDADLDYTTGLFGMLQAMLGTGVPFLLAALGFGLLHGLADRFLRDCARPGLLPLAAAVYYSAVFYELNFLVYFGSLRTALVVSGIAVGATIVTRGATRLWRAVAGPGGAGAASRRLLPERYR